MTKIHILPGIAAAAVLALAACEAPPPATGSGPSGISQAQGEAACQAALRDFHGVEDVRIARSEPLQGGGCFVRGSVLANFDTGARELWQCAAYADGSTGEIAYLADDASAGGGASADPQTAAEEACLRDVRAETGNPTVSVLDSSFSEAGTEVIVGVGDQRAPWRCIAYRDGATAGIEFLGSEGAL